MVTVTIDEITLNATRAALDERRARLEAETRAIEEQIAGWEDGRVWPDDYSEDFQRAFVWNTTALLQTEQAREFFSEVQIEPEQVDPITASKAANDRDYHTWQAYSEGELIGGSR